MRQIMRCPNCHGDWIEWNGGQYECKYCEYVSPFRADFYQHGPDGKLELAMHAERGMLAELPAGRVGAR